MNAADFDRQEKQVRNLRATLAVVIAKLRLNKTQEEGEVNQSHFVSKEGLIKYIQSLIIQAMEGNDTIEIPEFFYDRSELGNYSLLKQALSTALTGLQRLAYDKHLTLDGIYRDLMSSLRELEV
jgi:hypothetical protein